MKLVRIVPFLLVVVFPISLFAQGGGGGGNSPSSGGSATTSVENFAQQGGFIGGGRPDAFVGATEIYLRSSASTSTRAGGTSRVATTAARPRVASSVARTARTSLSISQLGNNNNRFIRSISSLDPEITSLSVQRAVPTIEADLNNRIQGLQSGQITFSNSPTGTTAVLTGTVASDRERRVAKQYLLLDGIKVDNQLEIR